MNLEYNTGREDLKIKEYGRNVQNLIAHIKTIADDKERNEMAEVIVNMMAQSDPAQKQNPEFIQKLWNHLYAIADYDIELDREVHKEEAIQSDTKMNYPSSRPRKRHYGSTLEKMIAEACKLEDGELKDVYVRTIVSYMKASYSNWTKENVADETIISDLEQMSNGQLTYDREGKIFTPAGTGGNNNNRRNNNNNNNRRNNNNNKRNINNNNNRRRR